MKFFKLIILFVALAFATGCEDRGKENPFRSDFTKEAVKGVYANGQKSFVYNDLEHQISTNSRKNTFRYQTHDQSIYVNILLSKSSPAMGQVLTLTVDSKGIADVASGEYSVEVVKKATLSGEELVWLWCNDKSTGFILPDTY